MPTQSKDRPISYMIIWWNAGLINIINQRRMQGILTQASATWTTLQQLSCSMRTLFGQPKPTTRNYQHLSRVRKMLFSQIAQRETDQEIKHLVSVSEQSDYLKSCLTKQTILSLIPYPWKVKISLGPLWFAVEEQVGHIRQRRHPQENTHTR